MLRTVSPPRYATLADVVRERIRSGQYKPGDRLPSEAELCASSGVSRGTAVRAIEQLVSEGIVFRQQGAGTFVAAPSLYRRSGHLLSFSETARAGGHASEQRLLEFCAASAEKAREFGCEPPAVFLQRVRHIDGAACAIHSSVIPMAVARSVPALCEGRSDAGAVSCPDFSLYAALDEAGLSVHEADERVTTRLAEAHECSLLGLGRPAAVMVVFRRSYSAEGGLVEAVEAVYRSDFYAYDMHLVRGHPDQHGPKIKKNGMNLQQGRET